MNAPRHQDPSAKVKIGWPTAAALAAVAAVVLAAAVWGGVQLSRHASAGVASAGGPRAAAASSPGTPPSGLDACRHELSVGDRLAAAADASYRDWRTHVDAQLQLDRGQTTLAETQAMWAASKARGAADVQRYDAARAAWDQVGGACAALLADRGSTLPAAQACGNRDRAVRALAASGAEVEAQWGAHLQMMANKAHTDGAAYHQRWLRMVTDAPRALKDYATARRQLQAAPRCAG